MVRNCALIMVTNGKGLIGGFISSELSEPPMVENVMAVVLALFLVLCVIKFVMTHASQGAWPHFCVLLAFADLHEQVI